MSAPHILVHGHEDNVGVVVVQGLKAGTDMLGVVTAHDSTFRLTAKVALKDLKTIMDASRQATEFVHWASETIPLPRGGQQSIPPVCPCYMALDPGTVRLR